MRGQEYQFLVSRPGSYWDLANVVVYIDEASFFYPALQMLAWRTVSADLVASRCKYITELDDFVVLRRASIFTISQSIEVLQFNPASRNEISDLSVSKLM